MVVSHGTLYFLSENNMLHVKHSKLVKKFNVSRETTTLGVIYIVL